ncbi:MAG: substrate-binding domain-containing protein [Spirochaetales bacterium]|nr:substrate-binding domain-containing protein [Spirochaetales bacterium]
MSNSEQSSKRRTIGMLINQIDGSYQAQLWKGLQKLAQERDVNLIYFAGKSLESEIGNERYHNFIYKIAKTPQVDGLVVSTSTITLFADRDATFLDTFGEIPMVSLSQPLDRCPSVLINGKTAMKTLVSHLIEVHGYKDFAFVRGPFGVADADGRFQGYMEALADHGLTVRQDRIFWGDFSFEAGRQAVYEWSRSRQNFPRVVVCSNDEMAMGALSALKELGLQVPEDVSVTGFDDIEQAHHQRPPLTTAHQPIFDLAYRAGEILLDILEGNPVNFRTSLEAPVIFRRSCGCEGESYLSSGKFTLGGVSFDDLATKGFQALTQDLDQQTSLTALKNSAYLKFVESLRLRMDEGAEDIAFWMALVNKLEEYIIQTLNNHEKLDAIKDYVNRTGRLVFEHLADKGNDKFVELSEVFWKLRRIIAHFGSSKTMRQLFDNIRASFPSIGIQSAYITLFEKPFIPINLLEEIPTTSQLAMAFSLPRHTIIPAQTFFSTSDLLPPAVLPQGRRYTLFVLPLVSETHADGLFIVEEGISVEIAYGMLAEQIVNALENTRRLDQLEVAEHKLIQVVDELSKSEERYREMAYLLPTIILETDLTLKFVYANQACLSLFGLPPEVEIPQLHLLDFIHPDDRPRFSASLSRVVLGELPDLNEVRLVRLDGQSLSVLSRASLIQKDNRIEGIRWSALDAKPLLASAVKPDPEFYERYHFSKRERDVVELILQGYKLREVADILYVSPKTVKAHITSIYSRTNVRNREEFLSLVKNYLAVRYGHAAFRFSLFSQLLRD